MEQDLVGERNEVLMHATLGMHLESITPSWKKPDTKGHVLYDFIYMKCPEQQIPRDKVD